MRISSIQGLRGFAVAAVVLYHFGFGIPNGFLGVDVFFVISGFVISRLLWTSYSEPRLKIRNFYLRRFQKLFLPMAVMLVVTLGASVFILSPKAFLVSSNTAFGALFGLSNAIIHSQTGDYFATSTFANIFVHTWSLAVEEQFYLVLPAIFLISLKYFEKRRVWAPVALLGGLSALSLGAYFVSNIFTQQPVWGAIFSFYSPLTRAWEFGFGVLVFLILGRSEKKTGFNNKKWSWVPFVSLTLLLLWPIPTHLLSREYVTLVAVVLSSWLIATDSKGLTGNPLLESKMLRWIGDRSYSIYLWHWPIFVLLGFSTNWDDTPFWKTVGVISSIVFGSMSYKFVEKPSNWKLGLLRTAKSCSLSLLGFLAAIWLMTSLHSNFMRAEIVQDMERNQDFHADTCFNAQRWCMNSANSQMRVTESKPVYLVGDSNAAMFFPGINIAAKHLDLDLISRTQSGCPPFASGYVENSQICKVYQTQVKSLLERSEPGTVVLGFSDKYVFDHKEDASVASKSIMSDMAKFVETISDFGHTVIVIEPIPNFLWAENPFDPDLVSPGAVAGNLWVSSDDQIGSNPFPTDFKRASGKFNVLSTWNVLCPSGNCAVIENGKFIWSNKTHISAVGSLKFQSSWISILRVR